MQIPAQVFDKDLVPELHLELGVADILGITERTANFQIKTADVLPM